MQLMVKKSTIEKNIQNIFIIFMLIMSVLVTFYDGSLNMIFYYTILGICCYFFMFKNHCTIKKKIYPILLYGMLTIGSTFFNGFIGSDYALVQMLWRTLRIFCTILVGYYYSEYSDEKSRKKMYYIIYILILISVAYGFYQNIAGIGWGYNSRMDSFFGHPITYGSILIFGFWMTLYLFKSVLVRGVFNIYIIMGLLSTRSRSAWIALALMVVLFLIKSSSDKLDKKKIFFLIFCIAAGIVFTFTPQFETIYEFIFSRFSGTMESASATQRLGSYAYIFMRLIGGNPIHIFFGYGEGAANSVMEMTTITLASFATTDCQYLTILYNYGLLGLLMIILFAIKIVKNYFKTACDPEQEMLILSILGGGYVTAIFYDIYGWLSISTLLMLFIGIYYGKEK
ncbi:O-antigen ligase family protein [Blautia sp. Marseille-P3201T]|uniref:O-antigen ligase family protein n=1 Tax=Blautia sp. Marseille-P3201T TaxID=1907659 RepID=UPI0009300EF6|nr:O-antigen ligase family protein [Blautia sp. Marseille-P3201T]